MKVTVRTRDIMAAVGAAQKAVPRKSVLPILQYLMLKAGGKELLVIGADLDNYVVAHCPAVVRKSGECCVPLALLRIQEDVPTIDIEAGNGSKAKVEVRYGKTKLSVDSRWDVKEYPPLPYLKDQTSKFKVFHIAEALKAVSHAMLGDENRPILHGTYFTSGSVVAADGFRLAVHKVRGNVSQPFVLSAEGAKMAQCLFGKAISVAGEIEMPEEKPEPNVVQPGLIVKLSSGKVDLYCRTVSGQFPKYESLIPGRRGMVRIKVGVADLQKAIKSMPGADRCNLIKLVGRGGRLKLSCMADEIDMETSLQAKGAIKIAVHPKYLADMLSIMSGVITLETRIEFAALAVRTKLITCVIMPMYADWGKDSSYEPYRKNKESRAKEVEEALKEREDAINIPAGAGA